MVSSRNMSRRVSLLIVWIPLAIVRVIGLEYAPESLPTSDEVR